MKKFLNIGYYLFAGLVILLGILLVLLQTNLLPDYEIKIVQSGSMEPVLKTGSVVLVKAESRYAVNDIVTFTSARDKGLPTTHRIVAEELRVGELLFTTKGDANEEADVEPLKPVQIIGKVIFNIPYLGFILDFARQPLGFILIVVLPALLIVYEEVVNMYRAIRPKKDMP